MAISRYKTKSGEVRYKAVFWAGNSIVARKSFRRKVDANEWVRRKSVQRTNYQVGRLKGERMTLDDFYTTVYWPNRKIREGTAKDYQSIYDMHVKPLFGHRRFLEVAPDEWSQYLNGLIGKGMTRARANRIHTVISAIYAKAVKWQYAEVNPLRVVDWYREDLSEFDFWNTDETNEFLNWAYVSQNPLYALYLTAYETGLRVSELIGLQKDCLDFSKGILYVRRSWCSKTDKLASTTKSGRKRVMGMSVNLKLTLKNEVERHSSAFVFRREGGKPLRYNFIRKKFLENQRAANVREISFHDFRHTFASHYLVRGGTLPELKELLGHAEYSTTLRYAHLANDHLVSKAGLVTFTPPLPDQVIPLKSNGPDHFPTIEDLKLHPTDSLEEIPSKISGS